jgi:hypothetical protein
MSTSPRNKEYTPPTKGRCATERKAITSEVEAFLKNGGSIRTVPSNLELTDANIKTKAKNEAARKRGSKSLSKVTA